MVAGAVEASKATVAVVGAAETVTVTVTGGGNKSSKGFPMAEAEGAAGISTRILRSFDQRRVTIPSFVGVRKSNSSTSPASHHCSSEGSLNIGTRNQLTSVLTKASSPGGGQYILV